MSVQRPEWHDGEEQSVALWHGLHLVATADVWAVYRDGERLTGGYWRQPAGQRPASAATRLDQHKTAAYKAAFRRAANGD